MQKVVIVINGQGGCGKDTCVGIAAKHYKVKNISSVDGIKAIAKRCGWDGNKDPEGRKFLHDLKMLLSEYNDFPNKCVVSDYNKFLDSDDEILFVHIREYSEIEKFRKSVNGPFFTLLIRRDSLEGSSWGNEADDKVENFKYDYVYDNNYTLEETELAFKMFLDNMLSKIN